VSLATAFDELEFGPERTLNLRTGLPTGEQAAARVEAWLRERQVGKSGDVLVITGRGKGSEDGIAVVREAVLARLRSLRRRNVVAEVREHTEGSFVVTLASVTALFEAPRRRREPRQELPPDPRVLDGLDASTRALLRTLASQVLDALGVHGAGPAFVRDEMVRQFTILAPGVPEGPDREARLRDAIRRATDEYDER